MKNDFEFFPKSQMCILTYFFTDNFFLGATRHTFLPTIFSTDIFTGDGWCRSENAMEISRRCVMMTPVKMTGEKIVGKKVCPVTPRKKLSVKKYVKMHIWDP